ncbi:uncharacterized protein ACMZJ9_000296 isoform 1-T2 [Mantella aurantiaca]
MAGLTLLLLLCHVTSLVSAVLRPPTNLKLVSENFQHILTWDDPNNDPDIYYQVDYQEDSTQIVRSKSCSNIASRRCDLTKDFTKVVSEYTMIVRSFTEREVSDIAIYNGFNPLSQTSLGPALVNVVPCDHCIEVYIDPPISHLWSEEEQRNVSMVSGDVYPILMYTIHYGHSSEDQHSIDTENNTTFQNLQPNTDYCVSVEVKASLNLVPSIKSALKCVTTGPRKGIRVEVIVPVVFGVVLFCAIFVLLLVLDKAGYICERRSFFPKVLKSLSQTESIYISNHERTSPTCIVPVEIVSQKLEVKDSQETEDLYKDGGYASRKRLLDSDTSGGDTSGGDTIGGDTSGAILSSNSLSVESSGQMTGSSDEERLSTMRPIDVDIISDSAGSLSPIPANTLESPSGLPFSNSGDFNVNLNSICIGNSADTWTGLLHGGSVKEEPKGEPDVNSGQAGLSLNGEMIVCTPNGLVDLDPSKMEYSSDGYEEDLSDNGDHCESGDHAVSGYMRR